MRKKMTIEQLMLWIFNEYSDEVEATLVDNDLVVIRKIG